MPSAYARTLAACGPATGYDLRIVDPESRSELPPGAVGEIWLRGDSVAQGYWRRRAAAGGQPLPFRKPMATAPPSTPRRPARSPRPTPASGGGSACPPRQRGGGPAGRPGGRSG
ncbi:AMP-binding protein [Streptomyces sp. XY332]|uniref:AMP-binding protein n=1 Tax=Streptomyces sp. XY332 TaxID=1415561 RepID=UPI002D21D7EC|nr:AMP-binding protein [Streptomyces sp. XY332]